MGCTSAYVVAALPLLLDEELEDDEDDEELEDDDEPQIGLVTLHPEPASWVVLGPPSAVSPENGQQRKTHVLVPLAVIVAADVVPLFIVCDAFELSQGSEPTSKVAPVAAAAVAVAVTEPAATQTVTSPSVGGAPWYVCPSIVRSHQPL
jgi:hypothetical protein